MRYREQDWGKRLKMMCYVPEKCQRNDGKKRLHLKYILEIEATDRVSVIGLLGGEWGHEESVMAPYVWSSATEWIVVPFPEGRKTECAEPGLVERGGCYNTMLGKLLGVILCLNLVTFYSYLSFSSLPSSQLCSLFLLYFFYHSANIYWDQLDARHCMAGDTRGYKSAKLHPTFGAYILYEDRQTMHKTCEDGSWGRGLHSEWVMFEPRPE